MRLLLCEDETALAEAVAEILRFNKYSVDIVSNGIEALEYLNTENYDGLILDIMMPKLDGISVLKKIRAKKNSIPIIILTAKSEIEDKVKGLDLGADDYLTKPFDSKELIARIKAMTRRKSEFTNNILSFSDISLNCSTYELSGSLGTEKLNNKEFQILEILLAGSGNIIPYNILMDRIWGYDSEAEENTVWVYISYLRKKLLQVSKAVTIKAIRGVGYKMEQSNGRKT